MLDDNTTDGMLVRVKNRALKEMGVMMVLNVDSGTTDNVQPSKKRVRQYKSIALNTEIVRDIVAITTEIHPASTLLDYLEVVR